MAVSRWDSPFEHAYAQFMDLIGVNWRYHPERDVDLGEFRDRRLLYTPDFRLLLPGVTVWVETKRHWGEFGQAQAGNLRELADEANEKCRRLALATGLPVYGHIHWPHHPLLYPRAGRGMLSLGGHPPPEPGHLAWLPDGVGGVLLQRQLWWCICPRCEQPGLAFHGATYLLPCGCLRRAVRCGDPVEAAELHSFHHPKLTAAYTQIELAVEQVERDGRWIKVAGREERGYLRGLSYCLLALLNSDAAFRVHPVPSTLADAEAVFARHPEWKPQIRDKLGTARRMIAWQGGEWVSQDPLILVGRQAMRYVEHWERGVFREAELGAQIVAARVLPEEGEAVADACHRVAKMAVERI